MNNLFKQLNNQSIKSLPNTNGNNLLKTFLNSSNPNELINSLISQNPQLQGIMQLFNSSGQTPKQFFYNYANSKGINPDSFINSLLTKGE